MSLAEIDLEDFDDVKAKYKAALKEVNRLQAENASLSQINQMYQEELRQKTEAFQKTTENYKSIQNKYEELLTRVTETQQLKITNRQYREEINQWRSLANSLPSEYIEKAEKPQDVIGILTSAIESERKSREAIEKKYRKVKGRCKEMQKRVRSNTEMIQSLFDSK